jgi:hypothetical protein
MPWAKLSDDFHSHRKAKRAGLEAAGLFALALSYCARYGTDGVVDADWLETEIQDPSERERLLGRLVKAGLFEVLTPGEVRAVTGERGLVNRDAPVTVTVGPIETVAWLVHDYLDFNPSREEAEELKRRRSESGRRGAEAKWVVVLAEAMALAMATAIARAKATAMAKGCPVPDPIPNPNQTPFPHPAQIETRRELRQTRRSRTELGLRLRGRSGRRERARRCRRRHFGLGGGASR